MSILRASFLFAYPLLSTHHCTELMDDDDEEESATKPDGEDPVAAPVAPESAPVPKKKQDAPSPSS